MGDTLEKGGNMEIIDKYDKNLLLKVGLLQTFPCETSHVHTPLCMKKTMNKHIEQRDNSAHTKPAGKSGYSRFSKSICLFSSYYGSGSSCVIAGLPWEILWW